LDQDLFRRVEAAVPRTIAWIDAYLRTHAVGARSVHSLDNPRLAASFPEALLRRTKTATLDSIDYPPIESFGLPEFVDTDPESRHGITFKDTYFVRRDMESESLHFHELVHVVQWERLGPERFLLAYGVGLAMHDYRESPLEAMAYSLQQKFYEGFYRRGLKEHIEAQTDLIWLKVDRLRASLGGRSG
jgi:hypothetical protein